MLKGINAWCFPNNLDTNAVMDLAVQAGFDTLELNFQESGPLGLNAKKDEVKAIADLAEKKGLKLPSFATGLFWKYSLTNPDPEVREKGKAIVRKMLEVASVLGADTILVVPGVVDDNTTYRQAWDRALGALKELAPEAETAKVNIGVENVWNKFLLSPLEYVRFIDEIGSDWVGSYFDVGNVVINGYPDQWITEIGSRLKKIHVKDFSRGIGNHSGFVPLLQGDVPWPRVAKALMSVGYQGSLTAELSPYPTCPEKLVFDTSSNLDRIIAFSSK